MLIPSAYKEVLIMKAGAAYMVESVLKNDRLEIQVNQTAKQVLLSIRGDKTPITFNQNDLFELMHTLLTINRNFNREESYFAD
jgi:hypothetical protein